MSTNRSRKRRHSREVWTILLSQVKLDTLAASGAYTGKDLHVLKVLQEEGCHVLEAARVLGVSAHTLRRHLSRLQSQLLVNLKVPDKEGSLNAALKDAEQLMVLVLPDGMQPALQHLLALKDSQRRYAVKQSRRDTAKKEVPEGGWEQVKMQQCQLEQLQTEKGLLQQEVQRLQGEIKRLKRVSSGLQNPSHPDMQKRLLEALKERDEWKLKAQRAIKRLEDLKVPDEGIIRDRSRMALLRHFQVRLKERFGVVLDEGAVLQLDDAVRDLPVVARTQKGTPVKQMAVGGKMVFVLVTPDRFGRLTATSAYTRDMLRLRK